jgi:hypothetical protein
MQTSNIAGAFALDTNSGFINEILIRRMIVSLKRLTWDSPYPDVGSAVDVSEMGGLRVEGSSKTSASSRASLIVSA